MRNKKSRQIVTGVLAVILIVTMLVGVVVPVFAAEHGGAEALFAGDILVYEDTVSNSFIVYDGSHENYRINDLNRMFDGKSYVLYIRPDSYNYEYKFIWGNEKVGFNSLNREVTDDIENNLKVVSFTSFDDSVSTLGEAIKKADFLRSDNGVNEYQDTVNLYFNFSSFVRDKNSLNDFLNTYYIYVVDSSDSVKYKIPMNELYKWTSAYIEMNGSSSIGNNEVESVEINIEEQSSDGIVSSESSEELEGIEELENVEENSVEVESEVYGISNTDSSLVFSSVDLSVAEELTDKYVLHVSIKTPNDVTIVSGYCKDPITGEFLYNSELTESEFDFEVPKNGDRDLYFVVEEQSGIVRFSDTLHLGVVDNVDIKDTSKLTDGSFGVNFKGLPDTAIIGNSVVFKMCTDVPAYMKFNGVAIGRNTLGTEFDVTVSDNGTYTYEAISEDGKVVRGEYNVSIFSSKESESNSFGLLWMIVGTIAVVCIVVVLVIRKKGEKSDDKREITEEDL